MSQCSGLIKRKKSAGLVLSNLKVQPHGPEFCLEMQNSLQLVCTELGDVGAETGDVCFELGGVCAVAGLWGKGWSCILRPAVVVFLTCAGRWCFPAGTAHPSFPQRPPAL